MEDKEIVFYNKELKDKYKKVLVKWSLITGAILLALILLLTLSLVFVNRNNVRFVEIFSSIVGVIIITIFNFVLLSQFFPAIKTYKHISLINKQTPIELEGVCITQKSENSLTLSSGIKCFEIRTVNKDKVYKVYYLADFLDDVNFPLLENITLKIISSYVVGYKYEK